MSRLRWFIQRAHLLWGSLGIDLARCFPDNEYIVYPLSRDYRDNVNQDSVDQETEALHPTGLDGQPRQEAKSYASACPEQTDEIKPDDAFK